MRFLAAAHTDVGITKKINQDAFCLKIARCGNDNVCFAVLCDGMGGLNHGELASALVVNAFSAWFEEELSRAFLNGVPSMVDIRNRWNSIALDQGQKILNYSQVKGSSMGTTLTALLIINNQYLYIQVGDSRLYKLDSGINQLTKDHTLVAYEVETKRITAEQAKTDSRQNVLLQCVGASQTIVPDIATGVVGENDVFLLCSDGFRHVVSDEEFFGILAPGLINSEKVMKKSLVDLVELNKSRGEKDNITALLVKAIQ